MPEQPSPYEIYGAPTEATLAAMRGFAERAGVTLTLQPGYVGGYIRLNTG